ncbi:MAG: alpha/beta fold hydrolase [Dongiaceae bacterium]
MAKLSARPMLRLLRRLPLCLPAILLHAILLAGCAAAAGPAQLDRQGCGGAAADEAGLRCYTLTVPLRRGDPRTPSIALPVVVIPGGGSHADPLVYLRGGPGYALDLDPDGLRHWRYRMQHEAWMRGRDLVLMEQRGQGGTVTLDCREVDALLPGLIGMAEPERGRRYAAAAADCRRRWSAAGYQPGDFDTAAVADDLEDLRHALGIASWNLYGVSYGTRLALVSMQRHPGGIRAAILDSAYPPEDHFWETRHAAIDAAFASVAAACAARPDCPVAGSLKAALMQRAAAYDASPVPVVLDRGKPSQRRIGFTGALLVERAVELLDEPDAPAAIAGLVAAGPEALEAAAQALADGAYAADGLIRGRYFATDCRAELPFADPALVEADGRHYPWLADYGIDQDDRLACAAWVDGDARLIPKAPIASDIPALVLQGGFDATTPPPVGRLTASRLSHGRYVVMPGVGHGVVGQSACARRIAARFLADPAGALDTACRDRPAASP